MNKKNSTYHRAFAQDFVVPQSDEECALILKSVIEKYGTHAYVKSLQARYPNVYKYIECRYDKLTGHKMPEKCYWMLNRLSDFPKCKVCGKEVTCFINWIRGYVQCCSTSCGNRYKLLKIISEQKFPISEENDIKFRNEIIELNPNFHKTYISSMITKIPDAVNYIAFRYPELAGHEMPEKIYWFVNRIEDFPKCKVCGKEIGAFKNVIAGYSQHCPEHTMQDSDVRLSISKGYKKHAKEDPNFLKNADKKRRDTKIKHGHSPTWNNSEKQRQTFKREWIDTGRITDMIERQRETLEREHGSSSWNNQEKKITTCMQKYGVPSYSQTEEFIEKAKATNQKNLGVDFPGQSKSCLEKRAKTCTDLYGVASYTQTQEFKDLWKDEDFVYNRQQKTYKTKRKHGTFNVSKLELIVKDQLISIFGINDIVCQYTEKRYPYMCDFYIKSLDTFIECNFHWTHGRHWFDPNSADDIDKLETWKNKNTKFYDCAIDVWTRRDILKRDTAKNNNLKYLVFWNINEFNNWIEKFKSK